MPIPLRRGRMNRNQLAVVAAAIAVIVLAAFAFTRPGDDGVIARGVNIDGIEVAGLTSDEALPRLISHEDALASLPVTVLIAGIERTATPDELGFSMDHAEALAAASQVGRDGSIISQFFAWAGSFFRTTTVTTATSLDDASVTAVLDSWDSLSAELVSDGGIELVNGQLTATYGSRPPILVRDGLAETLLNVVVDPDRPVRQLDTIDGPLRVSNDAVDLAMRQATELLSGSVRLEHADPPATLTISSAELARAFTTSSSDGAIQLSLDAAVLEPRFQELRDAFSSTFQNAELSVDEDNNVTITPGSPGLRVDSESIVAAILAGAAAVDRTGDLPVTADAEPDVTVADLEALGIVHLVSGFTTYHDCCQDRVVNIQLMADTINGTILLPGESLSINDTIGERTTDKGYLPAGTIVNGEIVDTVGGGVSQFATTMYNAVFWGGFTDIDHRPHSLYFSRYPEGIEATLDFPNIDLAFRNDTESALYIKTEHTSGSITVKLFGNNGGRVVTGEQRSGSTNLTVVSEGDPNTAVVVAGSVSDRFNFVPPETIYEADAEIEPGTTKTKQSGRDGWTVTVTRTMTFPDGSTNTEEWVERYRSRPLILQVHPCDIPEGEKGYTGDPCPTTTTSSTVGDSTTTTTTIDDSTTTTTVSG